MIDYYEQLTQEEQEAITEVVQTLFSGRPSFWSGNTTNGRAGFSMGKSTGLR